MLLKLIPSFVKVLISHFLFKLFRRGVKSTLRFPEDVVCGAISRRSLHTAHTLTDSHTDGRWSCRLHEVATRSAGAANDISTLGHSPTGTTAAPPSGGHLVQGRLMCNRPPPQMCFYYFVLPFEYKTVFQRNNESILTFQKELQPLTDEWISC